MVRSWPHFNQENQTLVCNSLFLPIDTKESAHVNVSFICHVGLMLAVPVVAMMMAVLLAKTKNKFKN